MSSSPSDVTSATPTEPASAGSRQTPPPGTSSTPMTSQEGNSKRRGHAASGEDRRKGGKKLNPPSTPPEWETIYRRCKSRNDLVQDTDDVIYKETTRQNTEIAFFDNVYNKRGKVYVFPDVVAPKVTFFKKATPTTHKAKGAQGTKKQRTQGNSTECHGRETSHVATGSHQRGEQSEADGAKKEIRVKESKSYVLDEKKRNNPNITSELEADECEFLVLRQAKAALEKVMKPDDPPVFILHNQDLVVKTKTGQSQEAVKTDKSQEGAKSSKSHEAVKTGKSQEIVKTGKSQEVAKSGKSHEAVKTDKSQQEVKSGKSQETVKTDKSQEEVKGYKSQEGANSGESQEAVTTDKSQEAVTTDKSQEEVKTIKSEEEVKTDKSQETVTTNNSQEEVKTGKSQETVKTDKSQETVTTNNSQEEVKIGKSQEADKTDKSQEAVKTNNSQEKVKIGKSQEADKTDKSQDAVKTDKSQEEVKTDKSQEAVKTDKSQEAVETNNSQEEVKIGKSQEADNTDKSQDAVKTDKSQEAVKTDKSQEEVKTDKSQEAVKTDKSHAAVKTDKSQEAVKTDKSQEAVKTDKSQEAVTTGKSQEAVKTVKSHAAVKTDKLQETVKTDKSQEAVKTDKSQEKVKTDKSQETVKTDKSQEAVKTGKSQEAVKTDKSQEAAKTGKSQEAVKTGKSQEGTKTGKSQEAVKTGKSQEAVKTDKSQEKIKTDKSHEAVKTDKLEKTVKPDKSPKSGKTDKSQKSDNTDKSEGEKDVLVLHPTLGILVLEVKGTKTTKIFSRFDKATTQLLHAQTSIQEEMGDLLGKDAVVLTIALPNLRPEDASVIREEAENRKKKKQPLDVTEGTTPTEGKPVMTSGNPSSPPPTVPPSSPSTKGSRKTERLEDHPEILLLCGSTDEVYKEWVMQLKERRPSSGHAFKGASDEERVNNFKRACIRRCSIAGLRPGQSVKDSSDLHHRFLLTEEQLRVRDSQAELLHISGPCGSGKTLLVAERARRWLREGRRVALAVAGDFYFHNVLLRHLVDSVCGDKKSVAGVSTHRSYSELLELLDTLSTEDTPVSIIVDEAWFASVSSYSSYSRLLHHVTAGRVRRLWTASAGRLPDKEERQLESLGGSTFHLSLCLRCPPHVRDWTNSLRWEDEPPLLPPPVPVTRQLGEGVQVICHPDHPQRQSWHTCTRCKEEVTAFFSSLGLLGDGATSALKLSDVVVIITEVLSDTERVARWLRGLGLHAVAEGGTGMYTPVLPPGTIPTSRHQAEEEAFRQRVLTGNDITGKPAVLVVRWGYFTGLERPVVLLWHEDREDDHRDRQGQEDREYRMAQHRYKWFLAASRCQGRLLVMAATPSPLLPLLPTTSPPEAAPTQSSQQSSTATASSPSGVTSASPAPPASHPSPVSSSSLGGESNPQPSTLPEQSAF